MDAVEEIKRRIDIAEYIGRSVALKRSGRSFRGLCPFHNERTPSFHVFPDRGTWRCYGQCGEGGDLFSFVQKREGIEFRDALRELAGEAGIELRPQNPEVKSRHDRLTSIVEFAIEHYRGKLASAEGTESRRYLTETRGLTPETIDAFELGWAPDEWRELRTYLSGRGFSDDDMAAAGMIVEGESGEPYDRFRARIIIPIRDEQGKAVGLGGRAMGDGQPKYLNSPQTELFDKGSTLYGLNRAGPAARELGETVVVEGYMDVIGPWQAGIRNVVATMGTSLTETHARKLRRFSPRIVLAMDPDSAGMAATERAGSLVLGIQTPSQAAVAAREADRLGHAAEIDLRVASLPAGKDPDELARVGAEAWQEVIAGAVPFPQFLVDRLIARDAPETGLEARRMLDQLRPVLLAVRDPVERAMYLQRIARRLGVPEREVAERIRPGPRPGARPQAQSRRSTPEEFLLTIILRHPSLRFSVRNLPPDLFSDTVNREIFRRWSTAESPDLSAEDEAVGERLRHIESIRLPTLGAESARRAAQEKIHAILQERLAERQAALAEDLANAEKTYGPNRVAELSAEVWRGRSIDPEVEELANLVIEELELGLSLHRREAPELT